MVKGLLNFIYRQSIIFLILLNILATITLFYMENTQIQYINASPLYHFYFIGQNSIDPFWSDVIKGAQQAAKDNNAVIEFYAPRFNEPTEQLKYLDIAILSKVDGIITYVPNEVDFTSLIDKAYYKGIPVITFENDAIKSKRFSFVGVNSFEIGKKAAELLAKATDGVANIAIISSSDSNQDTIENNLKMNGFFTELKNYPNMKIVKNYTSKMGILSAEEITQKIIESDDNINAIFTVTSADTLGAAQLIVDRNKVGKITIVGYGGSDEIIRYIEKEIIYGTVYSNPYEMGYNSIKALIDIKCSKNVPTFINTDVNVITKDTVESFKKEKTIKEN